MKDKKTFYKYIIENKGYCDDYYTTTNCKILDHSDCPLDKLCSTTWCNDNMRNGLYKEAIKRYISAYGKEELVEILL